LDSQHTMKEAGRETFFLPKVWTASAMIVNVRGEEEAS